MDESKVIEKRMNKVVRWFKNPYNLGLVAIILFAFLIRLYHFILTSNQPLWWDEAEYLGGAKSFAFNIPYQISIQRPIAFQFLSSLFLRAGLGEMSIKFILVLIPSVALVWATYFLGKEMFNKRIGLIAAFLMSVSWSLLFWTARVQPDYFSMTFQILAIAFMWRYWKNPATLPVILAGVFAGLGVHFKISGFLIPIAFVLFIFIKDRFSAFTNKHYYYFAIAFLLILSPYFIWSYATFNTPLGFTTNYEPTVNVGLEFPWKENLVFYHTMTGTILFVLFIIGVILALKFLFYLDIMFKEKRKCFNPYLFSIIIFVLVSLFYIFWIRETQDRWVFLWLPFIFFFVGLALTSIHDKIKPYQRILATVVVIGILLFASYGQIVQATNLIENRKGTYMPVRDGSIWLKENSNPEDVIFSRSFPQTAYYSERKTISEPDTETSMPQFEEFLTEYKPRYFLVSIFERYPEWINDWLQENQHRLTPVQAYFADAEQTQATLIIYEVSY